MRWHFWRTLANLSNRFTAYCILQMIRLKDEEDAHG